MNYFNKPNILSKNKSLLFCKKGVETLIIEDSFNYIVSKESYNNYLKHCETCEVCQETLKEFENRIPVILRPLFNNILKGI